MDNDNVLERLAAIESSLNRIHEKVEATRQYLLWMLIGTLVLFLLPLIGLLFVIPSFLSVYSQIDTRGL
jgi:type II secretory pathway component PulF